MHCSIIHIHQPPQPYNKTTTTLQTTGIHGIHRQTTVEQYDNPKYIMVQDPEHYHTKVPKQYGWHIGYGWPAN